MRVSPVCNTQHKPVLTRQPVLSFQAALRKVPGSELLEYARTGSHRLSELLADVYAGRVEPIDWNVKDNNGDNILMLLVRASNRLGVRMGDELKNLIRFANLTENIDVNYVHEKFGYTLLELAILFRSGHLRDILSLKNLDVNKVGRPDRSMSIIEWAVYRRVPPEDFEELVCHPMMDLDKVNIQNVYKYIYSSSDELFALYRSKPDIDVHTLRIENIEKYEEALNIAQKLQKVRKTRDYYEKNGVLTLEQIYEHVNNADCSRAVNMGLNNIGQTIAHFLAETHVNPDDEKAVELVNKIVDKLRASNYYFWREDYLHRTPPMLALESENFVVAKAMLERMKEDEFEFLLYKRDTCQSCAVKFQEKAFHGYRLNKIVEKLEPGKREEFEKLLADKLPPETLK